MEVILPTIKDKWPDKDIVALVKRGDPVAGTSSNDENVTILKRLDTGTIHALSDVGHQELLTEKSAQVANPDPGNSSAATTATETRNDQAAEKSPQVAGLVQPGDVTLRDDTLSVRYAQVQDEVLPEEVLCSDGENIHEAGDAAKPSEKTKDSTEIGGNAVVVANENVVNDEEVAVVGDVNANGQGAAVSTDDGQELGNAAADDGVAALDDENQQDGGDIFDGDKGDKVGIESVGDDTSPDLILSGNFVDNVPVSKKPS